MRESSLFLLPEQLVDTIKNDLYQRGYVYEQFLSLDAQMQQGSRQLLVCIGWLIYHLRFVEQCVEQCLKSMVKLDLVRSNETNGLVGERMRGGSFRRSTVITRRERTRPRAI